MRGLSEYVATVEGSGACHSNEYGGKLFETDPDSENRQLVQSGATRRVDFHAGLGETVERFDEESLSAFACENLVGDE